MGKNEFEGILKFVISSLVMKIIKTKNISEKDALTLLYTSELYSKLNNEKTKLWHFSAPMLLDMLDEEIETGKITYPEEA
ncbi:MAG: hypothetical protein ACRCUS_06990 [Anaerovoracaceae bacterium]